MSIKAWSDARSLVCSGVGEDKSTGKVVLRIAGGDGGRELGGGVPGSR